MVWQVRHNTVGVFMGVNHGKAHFSNCSECCRTLGVYQFRSKSQIETFLEFVDSPHLPDTARLKPEDFVVEPWSQKIHDLLLDEGLLDDGVFLLEWYRNIFGPMGMN